MLAKKYVAKFVGHGGRRGRVLVGWVSGGKVGCGWDGRRFEMFRKVCVDCMKFVVVFVVVGGRGGD